VKLAKACRISGHALMPTNIKKPLQKVVSRPAELFFPEYVNYFVYLMSFLFFTDEQVVNLVNMGRGKGVHAILGTQGLAELEKVDTTFQD
jgi:hypothetical protein